ncbi:plasmid mobilization protein [Bariatricus sp. HCP28S3_A7]|uniref:plasmid mobilization protein n=1 Tax=Bariatricus sp. HCP28S3_A7 TaxID=3438894 RepID=UPI003F8AFF43
MSNRHKNKTISFRITEAERQQIEARILASGMMKKDYFIRSCIYNRICVVGKKETIYPLVQTVNALYLQLLEMQKAFTSADADTVATAIPDTLPSSEAIKELQSEYTNMLTAIIDLLDGAKYLWEGDRHEQ